MLQRDVAGGVDPRPGEEATCAGAGTRDDPAAVISWHRAVIAVGTGAAAGAIAALVGPLELVPITAWVVATLVVLIWIWRIIWPQDARGTERLAEGEARSRTTDTSVLVAAVVSLAAVVLAVIQSTGGQTAGDTAAVLLSLVGAVLSWVLVNTVFALKYARLFYLEDEGAIDFKQREPPAYSDFAYLAFTVGMTFATSETEVTSTRTRKVALGHALLSYVFGTGVLAVAVNLVTNLGQ
jgi:uncharacterized membrane protein